MAADGRGCCNDIIIGDQGFKIHRLDDGSLFALSGPTFTADQLEEFFNAQLNGEKPAFPEDLGQWSALRLMRDRTVRYYNWEAKKSWRQAECPIAIGSGGELATGAMLAGADPMTAVRIASARDPFTGGRFIEEYLDVSFGR